MTEQVARQAFFEKNESRTGESSDWRLGNAANRQSDLLIGLAEPTLLSIRIRKVL
jgi:hypothetical protein